MERVAKRDGERKEDEKGIEQWHAAKKPHRNKCFSDDGWSVDIQVPFNASIYEFDALAFVVAIVTLYFV